MKHIIALTTLAAAASAQTAPASGLNYNSVTVSRAVRQNSAAIQMVLGQTNFVAGVATSNSNQTDTPHGQLSLGYVFKGVTQGFDATVSVIQANQGATVYAVELRRQLNEVYQGLEFSAGYAGTLSSNTGDRFIFGGTGVSYAESDSYVGLSYNINKTFAVGVSLNKQSESFDIGEVSRQTVYSVRANF